MKTANYLGFKEFHAPLTTFHNIPALFSIRSERSKTYKTFSFASGNSIQHTNTSDANSMPESYQPSPPQKKRAIPQLLFSDMLKVLLNEMDQASSIKSGNPEHYLGFEHLRIPSDQQRILHLDQEQQYKS